MGFSPSALNTVHSFSAVSATLHAAKTSSFTTAWITDQKRERGIGIEKFADERERGGRPEIKG